MNSNPGYECPQCCVCHEGSVCTSACAVAHHDGCNAAQTSFIPRDESQATPAVSAALSGRALDMEVAEKILGWERGSRWGNGNGGWTINGESHEKHRTSWNQTPRFSTNIAAAMEVIEKMRDSGWSVEVSSDIDWSMAEPDREWNVGFQKRNPEAMWMVDQQGVADSLSLPEAICLAALATVSTQDPSGSEDR